MTETSRSEEMKRYLFFELPEAERAALEDRFFEDSEYFYDLTELENDLIDAYARGELSGSDLKRFEQSLAQSPARRAKTKNARALQIIAAEENPASVRAPVPNLWERFAGFFNLKISALQFAGGALAILIACAAGFLIYQNRQAQREFAERERKQIEDEIIEKENRRRQLEAEQRRAEEERLKNGIDKTPPINSNAPAANAASPSEAERKNEIEKLRREIEDYKQKKNQLPPGSEPEFPPKEYVAVNVFPVSRGGSAAPPIVKLVEVAGKQQVKITQILPADKKYASFEIISNGTVIDRKNIAEGAKAIEFTLKPDVREFEIKVIERAPTGGNSESLGTYELQLTKNK